MELHNQKYFNRRNWILENLSNLKLSSDEALIVLMIDFCNEFNTPVSVKSLADLTNMDLVTIDKTLGMLSSKGYLEINNRNGKICFDIDSVFSNRNLDIKGEDTFAIFENEFNRPLSQKETATIAEWLRLYDHDRVIGALREASIEKKVSMKMIDRILSSNEDEEQ